MLPILLFRKEKGFLDPRNMLSRIIMFIKKLVFPSRKLNFPREKLGNHFPVKQADGKMQIVDDL